MVSSLVLSGREDLNLRLLGPEPSTLARLSYAPLQTLYQSAMFKTPRATRILNVNSLYHLKVCNGATPSLFKLQTLYMPFFKGAPIYLFAHKKTT